MDSDWEELLENIRSDFKNWGGKISGVRKSLEHWNLFINPFARLKNIVDQGRSRLSDIDLTLIPPEMTNPEKDPENSKKS